MIKKCEYCGNEYRTYTTNSRCCSKACLSALLSNKISCTCDTCGKEVLRIPSEYYKNKHHFCCRECADEYGRKEYVCKECGKTFTAIKNRKRTFCCIDCRNKYMATHQMTNRETVVCECCGKVFEAVVSAHRRFCSTECKYNGCHTKIKYVNQKANNE